jgi:hypothetical protein
VTCLFIALFVFGNTTEIFLKTEIKCLLHLTVISKIFQEESKTAKVKVSSIFQCNNSECVTYLFIALFVHGKEAKGFLETEVKCLLHVCGVVALCCWNAI